MSSKEQIKIAFTLELQQTGQYATVLELKQQILDLIAIPDIQPQIIYNFPEVFTDDELSVFKMCLQVEFGFVSMNIPNSTVIIDMINFLN